MPYNFRRSSLQKTARIVDLGLIGCAFLAALVASSGSFTWLSSSELLAVRIKLVNGAIFFGYLAFCSLIFSLHHFYRPRFIPLGRRLSSIASATTMITATLLALRTPFDFTFATSGFLSIFWLGSLALLAVTHEVSRQLQSIARLHGNSARNVVIVGNDQSARSLATQIENESALGYRVIQIITTETDEVYDVHRRNGQHTDSDDTVTA